jgi:hypothetical protein
VPAEAGVFAARDCDSRQRVVDPGRFTGRPSDVGRQVLADPEGNEFCAFTD